MDILAIAESYVRRGLSVIPIKADGSKSPAYSGWRKFSNELPSPEQLREWFGGAGASPLGLGIPAGPASGNLVILDFENAGTSAYFEWFQRLPDTLRQYVETLPTVATPSGGRHIYCRLNEPQPGAKLARYAGGKTKIEIRGEGHQVLAPGCPAECHPTRKLYEWNAEPDGFPVVPADVFAAMVDWCCQCNEYAAPEQPRDRDVRGIPVGESSPGNEFNLRAAWAETGIFEAGWKWAGSPHNDAGFLTRPGKESGISASVGKVNSKERNYPYLYVWSTSTDFVSETPFSKFAVYAQLKHAGNYSEAAKELARQGYGERRAERDRPTVVDDQFAELNLPRPDGTPRFPFGIVAPQMQSVSGDAEDPRPFLWASELAAQEETAKWIWKGYLARGGITLFSALWKSGKTTILSHLLKALDGSREEFLGQPVTAARILYVTEETQGQWAARRDALGIGNHVGFAVRPFRVRPTMPEWNAYLALLSAHVLKHRFDVVVFDTLSKMWPCREENDAGQVEESLMPLWSMCKEDVSVLLIHHSRKSGGEQFVGARGSGGLSAFVDILLEFKLPPGGGVKESKRLIEGKGRYGDDTPASLLAELRNGNYVGMGDFEDPTVRVGNTDPEWKTALWAILHKPQADGSTSAWRTRAELRDELKATGKGARAELVNAALDGWADTEPQGLIERESMPGVGGQRFLYRPLQLSDAVPEKSYSAPRGEARESLSGIAC
jgi:hypothetical protein